MNKETWKNRLEKAEKKATLVCHVDGQIGKWLKQQAKEHGTSVTKVVTAILEQAFAESEETED